jgi:hypothetical protein
MRFVSRVEHFFASRLKYDTDYLFGLLFCGVEIVFQAQSAAVPRLLHEVATSVPM